MAALQAENETFWNWIGRQRKGAKKARANSQTFITTLGDGSLVLGTVELKDYELVLQANSRQRAEKGRALIEPVLGMVVGPPAVDAKTVEEMMASHAPGRSKHLPSGLPPEEERSVLNANIHRYYMNLLDETVPALGNTTPRRAAKTAKGRQKLAAWLKYLENGAAKQASAPPMAGCDLAWMWDELGIAELRR